MTKYEFPVVTVKPDGGVYCQGIVEGGRETFCDVDTVCDNCPLLIILARYEYCKTHGSQESVQ